MAKPTIVTEETFDASVIENKLPVLADFWATWCPPCKIIGPILEEIAGEYDGRVVICKIDVDQNQALAQKYNVRSIPTLFFFKDGEIKEQVVGALPKEQIVSKIDSLLQD